MRSSRGHRPKRRPAIVLTAAVLAGLLSVTAGCTKAGNAAWNDGSQPGASQSTEPDTKAKATITGPAADAKDVPASAAITFETTDAVETSVALKSADGEEVDGTLSADKKSWLPTGALDWGATYTATVNATGDDGKTATAESTFKVMAKPNNTISVSSFLGDNAVVGVGMPMIVKFGKAIPQDYRDDVQRRLKVTTEPAQEGIWAWISPTEIHFRPEKFWKANTKVHYKLQTGGLPVGSGGFLRNDLTVDLKIGPALVMTVDNRTKRMTVTKDGKVIKTIKVSLGKKTTPSSSGTMIVIEKKRKTVFDTFEELGPEEGYRTDIDYAQRLTWGGEFIHAAPWSEGQQGSVNVSHGCVNVSMADGAWLFGQTRIGDPITVKGTERRLQNGNGWTDWNMTFAEYAEMSAIPLSDQ
ncbi:Ig-like domain-containing protein [Asanoa sp. NPDC050611]|uniref:L,D-transpeptidase n=1 Tax=Asanoa sp. NPDC050611 TaxID=3157098 RepID=UPI003407396F